MGGVMIEHDMRCSLRYVSIAKRSTEDVRNLLPRVERIHHKIKITCISPLD